MRRTMLFCLLMSAALMSCAHVAEYPVTLRYAAQKPVPPAAGGLQNYSITVTVFTDSRSTGATPVIGRRTEGSDRDIPARCVQGDPAAAVTAVLRSFLSGAGYTVTAETPAWDLQENSISTSWGALVIGGSIEELNVGCDADRPATTYRAAVRLRLFFADSQRKKILHTTTLDSLSALKHFRCTGEGMQEQINSALSLALEKILDNSELDTALREVGSVRDESLPE